MSPNVGSVEGRDFFASRELMITRVDVCDRVDQLPLFPYNRG